MSSDLPTDIFTPTPRRNMTAKRRLKIFLAHNSVCCLCKQPIDGTRSRWIVEHLTPLADGGEDVDENCAPAHETCAKPKTKKEAGDRSRMRKSAEARFGAKERKGFATNRIGKWKKKMDGSVVRRDED